MLKFPRFDGHLVRRCSTFRGEVVHGQEATEICEGIQTGGLESERSLAEVARDLGIAPALLHQWKQQLDKRDPDTAFPGHGTPAGPEDETRRLRRELEQVKQERDFLKKAAAFFARESP